MVPTSQKITVDIKSIEDMRYPTVGDYFFEQPGLLKFEIADTGNPFYNKLILIHELIEQALLEMRGVPIGVVDEFDQLFEKEREEKYHDLGDEPGFDPRSPYMPEHTLATAVEMLLCAKAGISWNDYNETIITL
jgi:hypothetical protein